MIARAGLLLVGTMLFVCGCGGEPGPAPRSRVPIGQSSSPPPPPAPAGSTVSSAPSRAPEPEVAEPAPQAAAVAPGQDDEEAKAQAADPANWRNDYYAFRKNISVADGKVSWGQMPEFAAWLARSQEYNDKARKMGGPRDRNELARLGKEVEKLHNAMGEVTWTGRIAGNPNGPTVSIAFSFLPLPAGVTIGLFGAEDEYAAKWQNLGSDNVVRFRCSFSGEGTAESPQIDAKMHLLEVLK